MMEESRGERAPSRLARSRPSAPVTEAAQNGRRSAPLSRGYDSSDFGDETCLSQAYDQDPGLRSAAELGSLLVLAVRAIGWAGAARAVDHQASEERTGEDGDEELKRPDGAT